jgi:N-acetylglucosamine kinase-like BadF-type ATPase
VEKFGQLASMVNAHPDLAALLPAILAAAVAGDELSKQVLRQAGGELAQLAHVVVRRLFAAEKDSVRLGLIGGVFRHASLVREVFTDSIRRLDPRVQVGQQVVDPVIGALQIARSVGGRN